MTNEILKLADKAHQLETEKEVMILIQGASIALNEDLHVLTKKVKDVYYLKYERNATSEEIDHELRNIN